MVKNRCIGRRGGREQQAMARRSTEEDWFKDEKDCHDSVVFVPATPGGVLKRSYEKANSKAGVRIPGTSLKRRLQKSDPFKEKRCEKEECLVCAEGDGGRCRVNGVICELTCKSCDDV